MIKLKDRPTRNTDRRPTKVTPSSLRKRRTIFFPPLSNIPVGCSISWGQDRALYRCLSFLKKRPVTVISGPVACGQSLLAQTAARIWLDATDDRHRHAPSVALCARVVFWLDASSQKALYKTCIDSVHRLESYFQDDLGLPLQRTLQTIRAENPPLSLTDVTHHWFQLMQCLPPWVEWLAVFDGIDIALDREEEDYDNAAPPVQGWLDNLLLDWHKKVSSVRGRGRFLLTCTACQTLALMDDDWTIGQIHLSVE